MTADSASKRLRALSLTAAAGTLCATMALLCAADADADSAHGEQMELAAMVMDSTPSSFPTLCKELGGSFFTERNAARCQRKDAELMVWWRGQTAHQSSVSYPLEESTLDALSTLALKVFGTPDKLEKTRIVWLVSKEEWVAVSFTDKESRFTIGRR